MPGYIDDTGFDVDDQRHPRWVRIGNPDGDVILTKIREMGFYVRERDHHLEIYFKFNTVLNGAYIETLRYPDAETGMYSWGYGQYTFRREYGCTMNVLIERLERIKAEVGTELEPGRLNSYGMRIS